MEKKQNSESKQVFVTKDMLIGDVVQNYPESAQVMLNYGLHCIGCHVNPFESIDMGAQSHGMPDDMIQKMVDEVNQKIAQNKNAPKPSVENASINVTEKAVDKIRELLAKEKKDGYGLRIEVVPGGCSGFSYDFSFENEKKQEDKVFEFSGLKIYVDNESLSHINGSKVDFVDSLHGSGFKVENPTAQHSCGCGKSFG